MTDRDVMERVGADLKRAVVDMPPRAESYKRPFGVSLKGADAVRLMVGIKSELGATRQQQVDLALRGWGEGRKRWSYAGISCAADGCAEGAAIQGLCRRHFNIWYKAINRGATTDITPRPLTAEDLLRPPASHVHTPEDELSWFAGLLEGEGCFTVTKTGWRGYPVLFIQMASHDVIERARRMLGATTIREQQPRDPSWSTTYSISISGAAAAEWMQRLRPMMGERRRAAIDAALDAYYPERLLVAPEHCVVPGCAGPHRGRGLCHKHYMSWLRDTAKGRPPRVKPLRSN